MAVLDSISPHWNSSAAAVVIGNDVDSFGSGFVKEGGDCVVVDTGLGKENGDGAVVLC